MANHHLRNRELSLKAKGLLSLMLSLPEDWDYTTKGLSCICKDGVDSICATIKEAGYVKRRRLRDAQGRLSDLEYTILEKPEPPPSPPEPPQTENPVVVKPDVVEPDVDNPELGKPHTENPAQLSIQEVNKQEWRAIGIACQFCTKFGMTTSTPTFQNVVRIEFHALVRRLHLRLAHSSPYIPLLHLHISTNQSVDRNDHRRLGILAPS